MLNYGQMIQAFLDQQSNDSVGIENEICPWSVLIPDHTDNPSAGEQTVNRPQDAPTSREQSAVDFVEERAQF